MSRRQDGGVDVRVAEDYAEGHLPGAISLPKEQWGTLKGLCRDKLNLLYCYSHVCHLAASAAVESARQGYPVMNSRADGGGGKVTGSRSSDEANPLILSSPSTGAQKC